MHFRLLPTLLILLAAPAANADIYKCVAEDGAVSYSQIPCPKQKSTTVAVAKPRRDGASDCRWAASFAGDVARRMRGGMASDAMFDLYGGVDSISNGTMNVINYVYRFRANEAMPEQRIASLAASMCKAGSLGDVSCEALPYGQEPDGGRCNEDEETDLADSLGADDINQANTLATSNNTTARSQVPSTPARNEQSTRSAASRESCRDGYRDQIDEIDAQMRRGYDSAKGEEYRERLRRLTEAMRAC
jgi:hypothetical protein